MPDNDFADDVKTLNRLGYIQELARRLNGFSNFAISLSIICILAGGLTSFHLGFDSVGGASIGIGWPVSCLFSLAVAATMAQVASAFPTAGGLYHWAATLGGRGLGWATAWFNLAGLVTVLAAINVGAIEFAMAGLRPGRPPSPLERLSIMIAVTTSQALFNHLGIRVTRILTDLSGYWILTVSTLLTAALLIGAAKWDFARLTTWTNYSGRPTDEPVWPAMSSMSWLFALGLMLPAYTITGFDASAHAAEETVHAGHNVPRGIVRSVLISGLFGWVMLAAIVLAMPDVDAAADQGPGMFVATFQAAVRDPWATCLYGGIVVAQYLCGLATVTSASRMAFAFARDGGLPRVVRRVSPQFQSPAVAVWCVAAAAVVFTVYTPVYSTITSVCVICLYISYVLPTAIGLIAYQRWWTTMGPWHLGVWFRPLAAISLLF